MKIDRDYYGPYKFINVFYYLGEDENENVDVQDDEYTIDSCRLDGNWNNGEFPAIFTYTDSPSFKQILVNALAPSFKNVVFIDLFATESQKNRAVEFFKSFVETSDHPETIKQAIKKWYLSDNPCFKVYENIKNKSEIPNMDWKLIKNI